ncbi:hypothetical protein QFZ33_002172 [Arthrobacter globiformis]|nr:hypothetical protein [Arthrobacter globiformis]
MGQNTGSCCGGKTTTTRAQDLSLTTRPEQAEETTAYCQVMAGTPVVKAEAEAKGLFATIRASGTGSAAPVVARRSTPTPTSTPKPADLRACTR